MRPLRVDMGGMSVAGTAEEISSDITLPDTRIASTPEVGTESNSGDIPTEWSIDEQDDLFAAAFCGEWKDGGGGKKSLTLGDEVTSFSLLKKYSQRPEAWQLFKREFVNQLTMDFATDAFVKLTWNVMGSNNPRKVFSDPLAPKKVTYAEAMRTKSFLTRKGWLKLGDSVETLAAVRQSPSMNVTINNNLERTPALFEDESIENSLGNFDVSGTFDVYDVDALGHQIYNDAVEGRDKVLQVRVERTVGAKTTSYTLTMNVHLGSPSESRSGNKLQFGVPFTMNDDRDLSLVKEEVVVPARPVFAQTIESQTVAKGGTLELDGTATVTDGGTVTYSWKKDGVEVGTDARCGVDTSAAGAFSYELTATNAIGKNTAAATQSFTVTVNAPSTDAEQNADGPQMAKRRTF